MKITKIILLLLILIGITTGTYAQEVDADQQNTSKYTTKRNPLLAAGLSVFTLGFGGGQYYNKQYVKGGIMTAIAGGTAIWMLTIDGGGFDDLGEVLVAALIFTANWAYSSIDAPISSAVINKRHGLITKVSFSPSLERNQWNANAVNLGLKLKLSLD